MAISSSATGLRPGVCTSTTRPTNPYTGQIIFQTDTGTMHNWDGAAWQFLAPTQQPNLLYNGAMQVAQRNTSVSSITSANYYTADRWYHDILSLGTWTDSIENDAPTGSGFRKSLKLLCTTADASPASTDVLSVYQALEGQDVQSIRKGTSSAQQLTLSFWVKSNVTGTYIAELYDGDNTRQVSRSYTISASGTWEFKTITFPADTTGAFDNDNAASLYVNFFLGAGSARTSGTLNTSWASVTTANRAVGQVNLASAINNYWQVTGVQLNVGAFAAPFEFKSYQQELAECERYYQLVADGSINSIAGVGIGTLTNAGTLEIMSFFRTTMRATPSLAASSGTDYYLFFRAGAADYFNSLTQGGIRSLHFGTSYNSSEIAGTSGDSGVVHINTKTDAKVAWSAEL